MCRGSTWPGTPSFFPNYPPIYSQVYRDFDSRRVYHLNGERLYVIEMNFY